VGKVTPATTLDRLRPTGSVKSIESSSAVSITERRVPSFGCDVAAATVLAAAEALVAAAFGPATAATIAADATIERPRVCRRAIERTTLSGATHPTALVRRLVPNHQPLASMLCTTNVSAST
jgi:hypothetical protein